MNGSILRVEETLERKLAEIIISGIEGGQSSDIHDGSILHTITL